MTPARERRRRLDRLVADLRAACDPRRERYLGTYFGNPRSPFVGLTALAAQRVARRHADELRTDEAFELLASPVAEHRYAALAVLVRKYDRGEARERAAIARRYLRELQRVDHWVLVDVSAPYILGSHLRGKPPGVLRALAASPRMTDRRVAIVATWALIRSGDYRPTLQVAELLAEDEHPLIQRAVGWMLREVGKRSPSTAERFLARRARSLPGLAWRSAIERLPVVARRRLAARRGGGRR